MPPAMCDHSDMEVAAATYAECFCVPQQRGLSSLSRFTASAQNSCSWSALVAARLHRLQHSLSGNKDSCLLLPLFCCRGVQQFFRIKADTASELCQALASAGHWHINTAEMQGSFKTSQAALNAAAAVDAYTLALADTAGAFTGYVWRMASWLAAENQRSSSKRGQPAAAAAAISILLDAAGSKLLLQLASSPTDVAAEVSTWLGSLVWWVFLRSQL